MVYARDGLSGNRIMHFELHKHEDRIEAGSGPFWSAIIDGGFLTVKWWRYAKSKFREFKIEYTMIQDVSKTDLLSIGINLTPIDIDINAFGYKPYIFRSSEMEVLLWEEQLHPYLDDHPGLKFVYRKVITIIEDMLGSGHVPGQ